MTPAARPPRGRPGRAQAPDDAGPSGQRAPLDGALVAAVLAMVERVPAGRVVSYGDVAELIERGGPRQVAAVLSRWGGDVAWWRVIRADGRPAEQVRQRAVPLLRADGVTVVDGRVDLARHRWQPGPGELGAPTP